MILGIIEQFNNSLIVDNRYKYIFSGLGNTIVMALFAVIIGLIFGL